MKPFAHRRKPSPEVRSPVPINLSRKGKAGRFSHEDRMIHKQHQTLPEMTTPPVGSVRCVEVPTLDTVELQLDSSFASPSSGYGFASAYDSISNKLNSHFSSASPLTVASSASSVGWNSPTPSRVASPYGFIPIAGESTPKGRFSPPFSPIQDSCWKSTSPKGGDLETSKVNKRRIGTISPSVSIFTQETAETASLTLDTKSTLASANTSRYGYYNSDRSSWHSISEGKAEAHDHGIATSITKAAGKEDGETRRTIVVRNKAVLSGSVGNGKITINDQFKSGRNATSPAALPKNNRRVKTELCMHYEANKTCPFGDMCTYAHGLEELKQGKLLDLHQAGLLDKDTYRTKPCWTWAATGSCPFGLRCCGIHDPRVGGPYSSWLPHTETQGNTMTTDINVEAVQQKRQHEILYNHPFGPGLNYDPEIDSWSDLYKLVCNVDNSHRLDKRRGRRAKVFPPVAKLEIALKMRSDSPNWHYKFSPQHTICGVQCMVLQKRAFCVMSRGTPIQKIREISLQSYSEKAPNHVLVREIAFGPDSDPSVRSVSLWFDIPKAEVIKCTALQAKRFRWRPTTKASKHSAFDKFESFSMIRPLDQDAYKLTTDMLKHRLAKLQADHISNMKIRYETLKKLDEHKSTLKERFEHQQRYWKEWSWPIQAGRGRVTAKTPVPPIDVKYQVEGECTHAQAIWENFCKNDFECPDRILTQESEKDLQETLVFNILRRLDMDGEEDETDNSNRGSSFKTLPVFDSLRNGLILTEDRTLPHIHQRAVAQRKVSRKEDLAPERCWRALLLPNSEQGLNASSYEDSDQDDLKEVSFKTTNEWEQVYEHFNNHRSKKVLNIIQKK